MNADPLTCCDCGVPGMGRSGGCDCDRMTHSHCSPCAERRYAADWTARRREHYLRNVETVLACFVNQAAIREGR